MLVAGSGQAAASADKTDAAATTEKTVAFRGHGTSTNPYTSSSFSGDRTCTRQEGSSCVIDFTKNAAEGIHILQSGTIPAYKCPDSFKYLQNRSFAPLGSTWGPGVFIHRNDGGLNISITGYDSIWPNYTTIFKKYAIGTLTGSLSATYTNWGNPNAAFRIELHCTSDINDAAVVL
jgi:hypothetical protein